MTPNQIIEWAMSYMLGFLLIGLGTTVALACFTGAYLLFTKGVS